MQQSDGLLQGQGGRRVVQQRDRNIRLGRLDGLQRRQPSGSVRIGQRQWHQVQQTGLGLFNRMVQSVTMESSSMLGTSTCSSKRPFKRAADRRRPRQHARARRGDARRVASAMAQAGPRNARVHAVSHAPRAGTRHHSTRRCLRSPTAESAREQVARPGIAARRATGPRCTCSYPPRR